MTICTCTYLFDCLMRDSIPIHEKFYTSIPIDAFWRCFFIFSSTYKQFTGFAGKSPFLSTKLEVRAVHIYIYARAHFSAHLNTGLFFIFISIGRWFFGLWLYSNLTTRRKWTIKWNEHNAQQRQRQQQQQQQQQRKMWCNKYECMCGCSGMYRMKGDNVNFDWNKNMYRELILYRAHRISTDERYAKPKNKITKKTRKKNKRNQE